MDEELEDLDLFGQNGNIAIELDLWDEWESYKDDILSEHIPSHKELLRRWWRTRLTAYIVRTLEKKGLKPNPRHEFGTEENLFERYPWMREGWLSHKIQLEVLVPTKEVLLKRWWHRKRHDFFMKHTAIRGKKRIKRLKLDVFVERLLWCRHLSCWCIRINVLVVVNLALYLIYAIFN
jgi:hypothetical protein